MLLHFLRSIVPEWRPINTLFSHSVKCAGKSNNLQNVAKAYSQPLPDVVTCVHHSHACFAAHAEFLKGIARIQEARYNREQSEGKIIDYHRVGDSGYRVIMREAITTHKAKVLQLHCYKIHVACPTRCVGCHFMIWALLNLCRANMSC